MPEEKVGTQEATAKEGMSFELRARSYSPRASVAISFLESLRWLKKKLQVLSSRRKPVHNNLTNEKPVNLARELRAHAARSKSHLHRSF
jgi:hypothetical protein